ncbi:MAG: hypothetical protein A4E34_00682 [Methanoregula sp. PtaU1.Bin006]|nr:MAG: hypothetical protein A4E34_00682 [Methanoregula sp. PtaU1.Bin006]
MGADAPVPPVAMNGRSPGGRPAAAFSEQFFRAGDCPPNHREYHSLTDIVNNYLLSWIF